MTISSAKKLLAVLIDGDNFPADLSDALFSAMGNLGVTTIRRLYGSSAAIAGWRGASTKHGIGLHEAMPGKNATDMRMAIDAMDILYRGIVGGFCIVSSDSDFAELARRLREDGVSVSGFGESKAAAGFRQACDTFVVLKRPTVAKAKPPLPSVAKATGQLAVDERTRFLFLKAFAQLDEAEWHPLTRLLTEVRKLQPDFTAKALGSKTPIALVRKTNCFDDELKGGTMMVRRRKALPSMAALATKAA